MKDRFKDKSPIAEAIAGPSIEDEILAALENQPQVQTTAPPMFAEPEPTGITEEGRLAEAVDVGRFEDQILQAAATEEPSTASRFVDGVIEAAKGIQPLEVLESTPRVLGGIVSGVGEGVARAPTDLAALAAAGLQKAEQLALEGLDVSEESRLKAEAEWDETVGFFLDISESISEGVGATREDISQADIPIASELFREKTETEQAFTELGTLFGGVTIGTRQALKSTNALGAKLSPRQQITTVARGGLTGEILVSNPDMDTASLSRQFGGAEFEGRLARVFESRIVEPGEGLAIAGTITGTIAGGKQIAKGVKFSKQKLDEVLAEGINKLPDKVLEKVPYDVRVGLAKPVTREEYITLSKSTDADVVNKVKSQVEDDLSPEALEAALKGHSSPKDDLLMLAAETNTSPSLLSEFLPDYKSYALNSKQLDKIIGNIGDPITSLRRGWKAFFNGYGYLQDMTRLKASQNLDLDIGHKDILERARMSKIAVIDSQTGSQAESLIGDPDKVAKMVKEGKSYVLTRAKPGQVKEIDGHTADVSDLLIRQENTKPLTQVHQEAWAKGATPAEVNDYEKALDGMDTIFNQELRSTQLQKEIKELAKGQDVGTILKEEPNSLIAQEIRNRQQAIKDYYTVDEANKKAFQETLDNFKDAEWVEDFVRDKNKINRIVLDELKEAGIISKRDFDNISRVRKNYTPLVRIVEEEQASKTMFERLFDLGPEDNTKPFLGMIKRRLSGSIEDTTESYAANITSISKSLNYTEMNRRKVGVLKELLELSDENFSQMFKESKLDVMKAIGKALEGTSPRSVTFGVAKGDAIENFYINGVKIGLTPKAKVIKDFFKYRAKDPMLVLKPFIAHAQLVRNMITVYDPRFQIRSLFGESDTAVMFTKHPKFVDYIPGVKLTKNVNEVLKQTKGTPDDVIQIFKDNYGVGRAVHAADLGGKTIKEQIKTLKSASLGSKTMGTITAPFRGMDNAFHNTAEAVELAPRIAEARAVLAKGGSMSEAITAGKGIGIDFSQRGYTTAWDTLFKSAPFLSSHMKGMDRTFRYMRYEPVTFLKRVLIYGAGKAHMARQWNRSFFESEEEFQAFDNSIPDYRSMNEDQFISNITKHPAWEAIEGITGIDKDNTDAMSAFYKDVAERGGLVPYFRWRRAHAIGSMGPALEPALWETTRRIMAKVTGGTIETPLGKSLQEAGYTPEMAIKHLEAYVTGQLAPGPMIPPSINSVLQVEVFNKDHFDRMIVPDSIRQKDGSRRRWTESKADTSDAVKALVKSMAKPNEAGLATGPDISPIELQHYLKGNLGDLSVSLMILGDNIYKELYDNNQAPEARIQDNPLTRLNFDSIKVDVKTGKIKELPRDKLAMFYQLDRHLNGLRSIHNDMKTKVRANDSLANVATENNFLSTYSQDLDLIPEFDKLNQELRELTNAEDIIKEDPNLEARQKRVLIEDLKAEVFQRKVDFIDIVSMSDNDDIRDMLPDLEYAGNAQGSMFLNWIADSRIKRKMIAREQRLSDYSEEDRKLIEGFYND